MIGPEDDLPTLIGRNDHINVLRYIRAHKLRKPRTVVFHGRALLGITNDVNDDASSSGTYPPSFPSSSPSSLGDAERLSALEQVFVSALDVGEISLADRCLDDIRIAVVSGGGGDPSSSSSSSSSRYRRLLGMRHESRGEYDDAYALYDEMTNENPSNAHAARRKYCVAHATAATTTAAAGRATAGKGDDNRRADVIAAKTLDDYLRDRPGDVAAWYEMADVCLSTCDYDGAAYCLEEVVLGCPLDSSVHVRLAEAYCTGGGLANAKLGRKHMAMAVRLDPDNLRAWYGLIASAEGYLEEVDRISKSGGKNVGGGGGGNIRDAEGEGIEVARELIMLGGGKLVRVYGGSSKMKSIVERMLKESSEML
ncbi:hypothetical protein ACHAXA_004426 [Cyclostephanos tholiformis]|uniref:ER membrane protein complex subunit 2 n=1 Tax=Cyclostephanos tholiformis TaxID=382380 RepID=A0ABD3SC83_9STRA